MVLAALPSFLVLSRRRSLPASRLCRSRFAQVSINSLNDNAQRTSRLLRSPDRVEIVLSLLRRTQQGRAPAFANGEPPEGLPNQTNQSPSRRERTLRKASSTHNTDARWCAYAPSR